MLKEKSGIFSLDFGQITTSERMFWKVLLHAYSLYNCKLVIQRPPNPKQQQRRTTTTGNKGGREEEGESIRMGNCAVTQHAVSWADDGEWELPSAEEEGHAERREHMNEVTIRITKRQLQELMEKRADGNSHIWKSRRSAAELLADIMNAGEVYHHLQHCRVAQWKPALQSIPEAVES